MKSYVFKVELIEEEDGGWSAIIPVLPGCAASGDTVEEAIDNVREAAEMYVDVLLEDGQPIPTSDHDQVAVIEGPAVLIRPEVAVGR